MEYTVSASVYHEWLECLSLTNNHPWFIIHKNAWYITSMCQNLQTKISTASSNSTSSIDVTVVKYYKSMGPVNKCCEMIKKLKVEKSDCFMSEMVLNLLILHGHFFCKYYGRNHLTNSTPIQGKCDLQCCTKTEHYHWVYCLMKNWAYLV